MKNIYSNLVKKLMSVRGASSGLASNLVNSCKSDFSSHNKNTELLFIWTILFTIITGLFVLAIKSNIIAMFAYFILAIAVTFVGTLAAIYYLYALKYQNKERALPRIHNILNKSFRLRDLFKFIKIPHFSNVISTAKNFKLAS
jgi:hypothetical protein